MLTTTLTPTQQSVFLFIRERCERGEPPTFRDICKRFRYSSPKAAYDHVAALEKKGFVSRAKGTARGLRIATPMAGIPVLGRIAAGSPRDAFLQSGERLLLDASAYGIPSSSQAFALRVMGDSMTGRRVFDGDIVVLEYVAGARHGDIVAALINNESSLKTLVRQHGKVWLRAENPDYPDLIPAWDLQIQGVARAVIRLL